MHAALRIEVAYLVSRIVTCLLLLTRIVGMRSCLMPMQCNAMQSNHQHVSRTVSIYCRVLYCWSLALSENIILSVSKGSCGVGEEKERRKERKGKRMTEEIEDAAHSFTISTLPARFGCIYRAVYVKYFINYRSIYMNNPAPSFIKVLHLAGLLDICSSTTSSYDRY